MIVNKKSHMALTVIALSLLLPATAFAAEPAAQPQQPETWGQTLGRWRSNVWNTSYPIAAQLGTTAATLALMSLHSNKAAQPLIGTAGAALAILLSQHLRAQQLEQKSNWSNPAIISGALAAIASLATRKNGSCPAWAILDALGAMLGSTLLMSMYNNWANPAQEEIGSD